MGKYKQEFDTAVNSLQLLEAPDLLTKLVQSLLSQLDLHWTLIYSMVHALWVQHR